MVVLDSLPNLISVLSQFYQPKYISARLEANYVYLTE